MEDYLENDYNCNELEGVDPTEAALKEFLLKDNAKYITEWIEDSFLNLEYVMFTDRYDTMFKIGDHFFKALFVFNIETEIDKDSFGFRRFNKGLRAVVVQEIEKPPRS